MDELDAIEHSLRLTKASRYLNKSINNMSRKFSLNNAEVVGIIQAIVITLVQELYKKNVGGVS